MCNYCYEKINHIPVHKLWTQLLFFYQELYKLVKLNKYESRDINTDKPKT